MNQNKIVKQFTNNIELLKKSHLSLNQNKIVKQSAIRY